MSEEIPPTPSRRIVSSRHLAEGDGWEASELEYGMIIAYNAFTRGREKRLTDICFLLNIEDTHTVNYALRKLVKAELLSAEKRGKEVFYRTSPAGAELCEAYRAIRQACFLDGLPRTDISGEELRKIAAQLRAMSGQYDQASRAAASL